MDRIAPTERFAGRRHPLDALQRLWDTPATERAIGMVLVAAFLGTIAVVELARRALLPGAASAAIPHNHFAAVGLAFTLLGLRRGLGLDRLPPDVHARFMATNAAYREKFAIPFVVCVREHGSAESILANADSRLGNTAEQEIQTALGEIAKIARLRLEDLA